MAKVAEYLALGVSVVCVLDPEDPDQAHLLLPDQPTRDDLGPDDDLTFPECLPGFRVLLRRSLTPLRVILAGSDVEPDGPHQGQGVALTDHARNASV